MTRDNQRFFVKSQHRILVMRTQITNLKKKRNSNSELKYKGTDLVS